MDADKGCSMARKKVAYRKRHQSLLSMVLVTSVVVMILVVVAINSVKLQSKIDEQTARETELLAQVEAEKTRAEEIEEYRKYTQTKKYVEEVAKDKLGLVYEGEILFKEQK